MSSEFVTGGDALQLRDDGARFVFFDLETTGLNTRADRILEIAAVRVADGGRVTETFHALVRQEQPLPPFVAAMTGISQAMLQDARTIRMVLPQFINFVEDLPLVAYNVSFDMGFLLAEAERLRLRVRNTPVCALQVARRRLPDLADHKLVTVASHLGLAATSSRRAQDACEAGLQVFVRLLRRLEPSPAVAPDEATAGDVPETEAAGVAVNAAAPAAETAEVVPDVAEAGAELKETETATG